MFDSVKFWLSQLNPATGIHSTKYHFLHDLKKHCELLGNSPDELVRERKEDLKSDDERVRHTAEVNLKTFMNYLQEKGLAPNTRKNYFTSIRSFTSGIIWSCSFSGMVGLKGRRLRKVRRQRLKKTFARCLKFQALGCEPSYSSLKTPGLQRDDRSIWKS